MLYKPTFTEDCCNYYQRNTQAHSDHLLTSHLESPKLSMPIQKKVNVRSYIVNVDCCHQRVWSNLCLKRNCTLLMISFVTVKLLEKARYFSYV